jgi:hypothetical protein
MFCCGPVSDYLNGSGTEYFCHRFLRVFTIKTHLMHQGRLDRCFSIYLSVCLSLSLWLYSPLVGPWPLFQFLNSIHSRWDSLDRGSVRHKAATCTQNNTNRINAHNRHPYLEWDSNPRSQCSSERAKTVHALARAATVIGRYFSSRVEMNNLHVVFV